MTTAAAARSSASFAIWLPGAPRRTTVSTRSAGRNRAFIRARYSLELRIQSRRQRVELALPEQPVRAVVDVQRFERVLCNLVGNAQDGGRILVGLEATPGELSLAVAADGPGIPEPE